MASAAAASLSIVAIGMALQLEHAQSAWLLLGAPLSEELVFRAGLQDWLNRRWHAAAAVLGSSLVFALCHVAASPSVLAASVFFPSLVLGALYARTGRLLPCVALHAAFNAMWLAGGAPLLLNASLTS